MAEPWTVLRCQAIFSHPVLSLHTDTIRNPRNGHEHDRFVIEMPDSVNVIPLTPDGHVVMIKVYRHATQEVLLEVPGGLVDPGETPLAAAHRELLEETGYQAETSRSSARPARCQASWTTGNTSSWPPTCGRWRSSIWTRERTLRSPSSPSPK